MTTTLILPIPKNFSFRQTLISHGWSELMPFQISQENWTLDAVISADQPIPIQISEAENKLQIEVFNNINTESEAKILRDVRHILRLDEDLSEFYKLTKTEKHLTWLDKHKGGRLLRSPTVYEDLVKTICTTNCSWALTKIMVGNLVEKLGEVSADDKKTFPTAEKMAEMSVEFYQAEIRAGYRAEYFKELAEKVATGNLNVESWLKTDVPTKELKKEMKSVKGVGNYAAENMLKLLGRYDGLALDSWLRGQFYKRYNNGLACDDKQIEKHYEKYGDWRGLVIWCEMSSSNPGV